MFRKSRFTRINPRAEAVTRFRPMVFSCGRFNRCLRPYPQAKFVAVVFGSVLCMASNVFAQQLQVTEKHEGEKMESSSKCPVMGAVPAASARHTAAGVHSNGDWWPNQLNV